MDFKKLFKWALVVAVIFVGIKFSLAYVNYLQLKSIMEQEALDARRMRTTEEVMIKRIRDRADSTSVYIPEPDAIEFTVDGMNERDADLVITAVYEEEVDLLVYQVRWERTLVASADAPDRE